MAQLPCIILPGFGDSGPDHWQSRWQNSDQRFTRFMPTSWLNPHLEDWLSALDHAVAAVSQPPILVAHSLSCLLVAHAAAQISDQIAGALLVAPPDPERPDFPAAIVGFKNPPQSRFRFPATVVTSSNDPYARAQFGRDCAQAWGARHVDMGACGHINAASGIGDWPAGRALLKELGTSTSRLP